MITLKELTPIYCEGYIGIDGEWYHNSQYSKKIKVDNHHYFVKISKNSKGKWKLVIYLCLTACNSCEILIATRDGRSMKALKQVAIDEINEYQNSFRCALDIEKSETFDNFSDRAVKYSITKNLPNVSDYQAINDFVASVKDEI